MNLWWINELFKAILEIKNYYRQNLSPSQMRTSLILVFLLTFFLHRNKLCLCAYALAGLFFSFLKPVNIDVRLNSTHSTELLVLKEILITFPQVFDIFPLVFNVCPWYNFV